MMRRFSMWAAGSLTLLALSGCGHPALPGSHATTPQVSPIDSKKSPDDSNRLKLDFPPHSRQLDQIPFKVTYADKAGKPVHGASVVLDLSMPEMAMPENKVVCKETTPGVYKGSGHFTMAGHWKIWISAKSPGMPGVSRSIDPIAVE